MDRERWDRVRQLFHEALDRPPAEREAFLQANEADPALRAEVRGLLEADADPGRRSPVSRDRIGALLGEAAGSLLGDAAGSPADPPPGADPPSLEGRRIGPYRVIRRIGQGGMGAVYLAEREDVSKQVALKLVRGALGAPELAQRFLLERRVLARLEHPGIARLMDAGMTEDETPWFAMEYVEGEPITTHCDSRALSPEARLRLFCDVCDAVTFAHANLVVHRDIKPSNVMVTPEGKVKLLDFGIAKLLGADDDDTLTRTGVRVMSPAYAAPEQLAGEPVTTATDVYALGALLYEILTGARPRDAGAAEVFGGEEPGRPTADLRALPPRPSTVRSRRGDRSGAGRLEGDLDAICLKAVAPEPERRYRSAEQLRDDVTRHLTGLPVEARLPTLRYRTGKFLRRHASAVAGAAVLALALGGGLGAALWQGQRAERSRLVAEEAREDAISALARSGIVTEFLAGLFRAANPNVARGEDVTAVELVDRGVEQIDELSQAPPLQAEILEVLTTVNLGLGRFDEAARLMERSVEIRRTMPPDSALVGALNILGRTYSERGLPGSAATAWAEALEVGLALWGQDHPSVMAAQSNLAVAYGRLGRDSESEHLLRDLMASERRVLGTDHEDRSYTLNNLALRLTNRGAYDEAEPLAREALQLLLARFGEEHPGSGLLMDNLGMVLREAGRYDEAEPVLRRGLAIRLRVLGDEHRYYGESLFALGTLLVLRGRPGELEEAEAMLRQGLRIYHETLGADHPGNAYVLHSLGMLAENRGDLVGAEARYRDGLAIRRGSERDNPTVAVYSLAALSRVLRPRDAPEALEIAREAVALAETHLAADHPNRTEAEAHLGLAMLTAGDSVAGAVRFATGVDGLAAVIGPGHPRVRKLCAAGADAGLPAPPCDPGTEAARSAH